MQAIAVPDEAGGEVGGVVSELVFLEFACKARCAHEVSPGSPEQPDFRPGFHTPRKSHVGLEVLKTVRELNRGASSRSGYIKTDACVPTFKYPGPDVELGSELRGHDTLSIEKTDVAESVAEVGGGLRAKLEL